MKIVSNMLRKRIEAEEQYSILTEFQEKQKDELPFLARPRLVTRKFRSLMIGLGAIMLAILIAEVAVIANFLIFVKLLHFYLKF